MKKFGWVLINIISFGIPALVARNKAKKRASEVKNELTYNDNVGFEIDSLILVLGGKENIAKTSFSLSSVTINVKDITKVNLDGIKQYCKGFSRSNDSLILLTGNTSKSISNQINNKIYI